MRYPCVDAKKGQAPPGRSGGRDDAHIGAGPRRSGSRGFVPAVLVAGAMLLSTGGSHAAFAASGGPYTIDPSVVGGGGATLTGGSFSLSGTIGQPATAQLAGSGYSLYDGFWAPAAAPTDDLIFANGFDP